MRQEELALTGREATPLRWWPSHAEQKAPQLVSVDSLKGMLAPQSNQVQHTSICWGQVSKLARTPSEATVCVLARGNEFSNICFNPSRLSEQGSCSSFPSGMSYHPTNLTICIVEKQYLMPICCSTSNSLIVLVSTQQGQLLCPVKQRCSAQTYQRTYVN